jgi:hypothetical protein
MSVLNRAATLGTVWMGLTWAARCHNHKYDPISQKEFLKLTAYFNTQGSEYSAFTQNSALTSRRPGLRHDAALLEEYKIREPGRLRIETAAVRAHPVSNDWDFAYGGSHTVDNARKVLFLDPQAQRCSRRHAGCVPRLLRQPLWKGTLRALKPAEVRTN